MHARIQILIQKMKGSFIRLTPLYARSVALGKRVGWWKLSLAGGVILGILITLVFTGGSEEAPKVERSPRSVTVRSIAELSAEEAPLPVVGTVISQSEAELRSGGAGQIVSLYRELGDYVRAGDIIAEMENGRERAAVLQAEGGVDAAEAQLLKITRGARDEQLSILELNTDSAKSSLASARASAVNTLLSAYATVDETVRRKADQMFSSPETSAPKFNLIVPDAQLTTDLETGRVRMTQMLMRQDSLSQTLAIEGDLTGELVRTEGEVREVKNFLDKLTAALNKAITSESISSSDISSYKTDANASRTSITTTLSSLTSARDTLASKEAALAVAEKNLEQGVEGGQAEDVAAAEAALKQARGNLASARAALEETIVRSPISGTINMLSVKRGDFVTAFVPVATIANNNALEVRAYITETDARDIAVGAHARIEGSQEGIVTRIAPALDPSTKKIEVRIGLEKGDFLNGQAVTVALSRSGIHTSSQKLIVPLSSLKVGVTGNVVFSLNEELRLSPHEVKLGELLGDRVVIEEGVSADLRIVLDARGLKAGDTVMLK